MPRHRPPTLHRWGGCVPVQAQARVKLEKLYVEVPVQ